LPSPVIIPTVLQPNKTAMSTQTSEENQLEDALIPNKEMPIRLAMFEGPLDLLLFLIRKNEVDIYDIPIESVTRQYMDILNSMDKLNLEIAGEFFVMAATLMYIKSRMLLPTNEQPVETEEEDEDIDPRWELVQQLLEYKKFKEAANQLEDCALNRQDLIPRIYQQKDDEREERPLKNSDRIELWNTFNMVLRRLAEKMTHGEIHDEQVSIADRMEFLLNKMETEKQFSFSSIFRSRSYSLNMLVTTFLAVLELTRMKRMLLEQTDSFQEILITALDEPQRGMDAEDIEPDEDTEASDAAPPPDRELNTDENIDVPTAEIQKKPAGLHSLHDEPEDREPVT